MKIKNNTLLLWLPAFIWLAVIFIVGSTEIDYLGGKTNFISKVLIEIKMYLYSLHSHFAAVIAKGIDKIYHAFEYMVFALLLYPPLTRAYKKGIAKTSALIALIVILTAAADELHQIYVPTRFCSATDFLADVIGLLIAQGAVITIYFLRRRNGVLQNQRNQ